MIRVLLPSHLKALAGVEGEVGLQVTGPVTQKAVLDALEDRFPALRGTIRDRATGCRRPYVRFFAVDQDLSQRPPDEQLPAEVAAGSEPFCVIGAIAGG